MKQKILIVSLLFIVSMISFSCNRVESTANCIGEAMIMSITHTANGTNPKEITYTLKYNGNETISSIEWDFGDGQKTTTTDKVVTHVYSAGGNYTLRAGVRLNGGQCTVYPTINIVVN